jgi:hypothetical protein
MMNGRWRSCTAAVAGGRRCSCGAVTWTASTCTTAFARRPAGLVEPVKKTGRAASQPRPEQGEIPPTPGRPPATAVTLEGAAPHRLTQGFEVRMALTTAMLSLLLVG